MKIVVIGRGLIGSNLANTLTKRGHNVKAVSPSTGVNAVTGQGVPEALAGAQICVDVSNSPSFDDKAAWDFFTQSTSNLLNLGLKAGIKHHVILSVVGTERITDSGYFRAKAEQERLVKNGKIPYTIVKATQFMEFLDSIVGTGTDPILVPAETFQPIASSEVVSFLADYVEGNPLNGEIEIAGPEKVSMAKMAERYLKKKNDPRTVRTEGADYFGAKINNESLVPGKSNARIGKVDLDNWYASRL